MLDPQGTEEITKLILELKEKYNKTIITITHDLGLAMKSDRVILLREGKILLDKSPEEVFKERELYYPLT
jgi:energy-coupling factor transport system ATP-binding protein